MELKITYNHVEKTPAIDDKIKEKAERLKKYFDGKIQIHWTCNVENTRQTSNVTVTGKGFTANAHATDDNLYKTFDMVMEKLEKQLLKRKEKTTDKHRDKLDASAFL